MRLHMSDFSGEIPFEAISKLFGQDQYIFTEDELPIKNIWWEDIRLDDTAMLIFHFPSYRNYLYEEVMSGRPWQDWINKYHPKNSSILELYMPKTCKTLEKLKQGFKENHLGEVHIENGRVK